jgi:hypothetical protein
MGWVLLMFFIDGVFFLTAEETGNVKAQIATHAGWCRRGRRACVIGIFTFDGGGGRGI